MNCQRSEELWTDFLEGNLAAPLASELRAHLDACDACRELFGTFTAVVDTLSTMPAPEVEPTLHGRIIEHSRQELTRAARRSKVASRSAPPTSFAPLVHWIAAAAVLAAVLVWRPPGLLSDATTAASKAARQTYSFGVRTYRTTERWVDDLNVLRMTVGVAFEDRLDRLNEQLQIFSESGEDSDEDQESRMRGGETSRASLLPDVLTRSHL